MPESSLSSLPISMMTPQPPPTAPRPAKITMQNWPSVSRDDQVAEQLNYANHVRCSSLDSVDSNMSTGSSSGSGVNHTKNMLVDGEFIPTRTVTKTPSIPSHNPMQFVKVQSPLYKKAEHQIKLVKEVKISKGTLKETEEEWQSNLDNWKSRRRKVSEKVIKRAEESKQIEQAEQLRQHKDQQRKIKTFSEIIEKRSSQRNYHLDLYVGGDDSGVGGTPEPDEHEGILANHQSNSRSDTSEGMTSETDSLDSDVHNSEKIVKEPPKVPKKPHSWLTRQVSTEAVICGTSLISNLRHTVTNKDSFSENASSAEPSDVEGPPIETSEDVIFGCPILNVDSSLESLSSHHHFNDITDSSSDLSQDSYSGMGKHGHDINHGTATCDQIDNVEDHRSKVKLVNVPESLENGQHLWIRILTLQNHDSKDFGFNLSSGKDELTAVYVENIIPDSPADLAGLKIGDKILSINNKSPFAYSTSSLAFSMKPAVFSENMELYVYRLAIQGCTDNRQRVSKRGEAFAQKLALFDDKTPPLHPSLALSQSSKISTEEELQKESLVLRRRSAFENNSVESDKFKNRRSSCVFNNSTNGWKNLNHTHERRLSLDCIKTEDNTVETIKKKPPPVPAKPKKSKLHKQETIQSVENKSELVCTMENPSVIPDGCATDELQEIRQHHSVATKNFSKENGFSLHAFTEPVITNESNLMPLHCSSGELVNQIQTTTSEQNSTANVHSLDVKYGEIPHCNPSMADAAQNINDTINSQIWDFHTTIDESVSPECIENDVNNVNNDLFVHSVFESLNENESGNCSKDCDLPHETVTINIEPQTEETNYKSIICIKDVISDNTSVIDNDCTEIPNQFEMILNSCPAEETLSESPCQSKHKTLITDIIETENRLETMEIADHNDETVEHLEHISQYNVFSLNKVEEDEVSASTNSSSDSPDTETVIDNLPNNLSPLPNDDGTETQSLNPIVEHDECDDFHSACITQVSENLELVSEEISFEVQEPTTGQLVHCTLESNPYSNHSHDNRELYDNELEECADTLSPLDVIDQMELKLMQQLEQQALDDFADVSNNQLEEVVNRQLLYLSEDAVLLEDLDAPRNMIPPNEPPPPPPPEPEKDSFQRINSTKRIKKEIWRRRSDFLGLDSPDGGISIDDLPPPPPGLNDLLKSEMEMQREQRLFLEKQLPVDIDECTTLNDPAISFMETPSYLSNPMECNSDYTLEVLDAEVFDAVIPDEQQQNTDWITKNECEILASEVQKYEDDAIEKTNDIGKVVENPQHKAKSHIQTLGAAPRAKIVDSNKWITQTEHVPVMKQRSVDPIFQHENFNQNFWLIQEASQKTPPSGTHTPLDRRYSMPPTLNSRYPDVTVRTWSDREVETQLQPRPKSMIWQGHSTSFAQSHSSYIPADYFHNTKSSWTENTSIDCEDDKNTLSVNHLCSRCSRALSEGSAMGIDTLQLYFHIECFKCCICQLQLGNGSCGMDVQVKNSQLYCPKCFFDD